MFWKKTNYRMSMGAGRERGGGANFFPSILNHIILNVYITNVTVKVYYAVFTTCIDSVRSQVNTDRKCHLRERKTSNPECG